MLTINDIGSQSSAKERKDEPPDRETQRAFPGEHTEGIQWDGINSSQMYKYAWKAVIFFSCGTAFERDPAQIGLIA